ncbi:arginine repressor [Paucilactobacillus oligofermentans DSM 15707 = LMG 22743]|uniref:Arginine repressor n=1 Tax=Paucilactobacillus oligofermentans DSM 15707 = LMG 22743 TaxID=1423778 RepID=A0A0R1RHK8_9LACO|nr:ArgR family transcriptional regulator [Paucilactobacillus oligofermentans]KRL56001.1 arginine repressor [Paucilactobacillus oligofermentans DSM 15707 = LMG 22743]CUS26017.1 Arginine repressor 2 [Paucilactobacillus oligofermentans DSM 15707 = LMG 22743]
MKKSLRQAKIEQIISQYSISTQDDLLNKLTDAGISATQATISRDIREMQIVKSADGTGELRYTIFKVGNRTEQNRLYTTINDVVTNVTQVEFMNIVRTLPSDGNMLAAIIDDLSLPEVAGTLAGHDTIFIISPNQVVAKKFNQKIKEHINENIYVD